MPGTQGIVAAIDMGTAKVACLIGRVERAAGGQRRIRVLGVGQHEAQGIDRGAVVDLRAGEDAVRCAVEAAEEMAGVRIRKVHVNLSTGTLTSWRTGVEIPIPPREITTNDLHRVLSEARARLPLGGRVLAHAVPLGYSVDGVQGIRDPRGMAGRRLGVNLHLVTAAPAPLRNLKLCIERAFLDIAGLVATPYAGGLACLVEDEMQMGATLIDLGAGTVSLARFRNGRLVDAGMLNVGGGHVTRDISAGLSTPLEHAERLKTLHGNALPGHTDDREYVDVPQIGDEPGAIPARVPRSLLIGIIRPRMEEIFELARDRLAESGEGLPASRRIVLTGGASLLPGARELAERILNAPVRLARPNGIDGLPETVNPAGFSVCAGLAAWAVRAPMEAPRRAPGRKVLPRFIRARRTGLVARWMRAVF
ncbi:MAG: cell division protein FtsA [Alphaproteobacteria bacterium]